MFSCSTQETQEETLLQEGKWNPQVRKALNELLRDSGKGAYAVFDFDQTTIVHDITQALWVYQIEHLRYADAPVHHFLDGSPQKEVKMPGKEDSYAEMGEVLTVEYNTMKSRLDAGESIETIRQSDEYLDFRARMVSLIDAMDEQYGSWVTFLWQPGRRTMALTQRALGWRSATRHLDIPRDEGFVQMPYGSRHRHLCLLRLSGTDSGNTGMRPSIRIRAACRQGLWSPFYLWRKNRSTVRPSIRTTHQGRKGGLHPCIYGSYP